MAKSIDQFFTHKLAELNKVNSNIKDIFSHRLTELNCANKSELDFLATVLIELYRLDNKVVQYAEADIENLIIACGNINAFKHEFALQFIEKILLKPVFFKTITGFIETNKCSDSAKKLILQQWISSENYSQKLDVKYFFMYLDIARRCGLKYGKFKAIEENNFELILCSRILNDLESSDVNGKALVNLAYATYILSSVLAMPETEYSFDALLSLNKFAKLSKNKALYNPRENTWSTKILPGELIYKALTDVRGGAPNFIKAILLIRQANFVVLPRVLRLLEDKTSVAKFEAQLLEYYSYISNNFIPNLFNVLHMVPIRKEVTQQICYFLLNFPINSFQMIEKFVIQVTRHLVESLDMLKIDEILSLVQLNEFVEAKYLKNYISDYEKTKIIKRLLQDKDGLNDDMILQLMRMRFTIFNGIQDILTPLNARFQIAYQNQVSVHSGKLGIHQAETELFNFILAKVTAEKSANLEFSHVCNMTGKEIDITFVDNKLKVAIHIDGKRFHYYLDREENDRKTFLRNFALHNAGWTNICQTLPREVGGSLDKEKSSLIGKLSGLVPLNEKSLGGFISNQFMIRHYLNAPTYTPSLFKVYSEVRQNLNASACHIEMQQTQRWK